MRTAVVTGMGLLFLVACGCPTPAPRQPQAACPSTKPLICPPLAPPPVTPPPVAKTKTPRRCDVEWSAVAGPSLSEAETTRWFASRGVERPTALTCHRALSWPKSSREALLCSRTTVVRDQYAEVRMEVLGMKGAQLETWLNLPVAVLPMAGPVCSKDEEDNDSVASDVDDTPKPLVYVETVVGPDGQTLIVRNTGSKSCRDLASRSGRLLIDKAEKEALAAFAGSICDSRGVYAWQEGKLTRREDGVVLDGPSVLGRFAGGRLPGPCVDPHAHLSHKLGGAMDESGLPPMRSDVDLDGDGQFDLMLFAGAARWEVSYALYVRREGCSYYVGDVQSSEWPRRLPQRSNGLYELLTSTDGAISPGAKHGYVDSVWRFDGTAYRARLTAATPRRPAGIRP